MSLTLTQYPSGNCFRNKVTKFVMTSTYSVTMTITINPNGQSAEIFTGRYHPDFNGRISVDITDIVKDYVKSTVPTNANDYAQTDFSKEFSYKIEEDNGGSAQGTFKVFNIACNTAETLDNWCAAHFLTHQSVQKRTNYESPEWLTWNDLVGNYSLVARFYPNNGGNTEVTLQTDSAAGCYTVNVCYSKLIRTISMLPRQLKGYYDIILFDNSSNELARQRYIYQERSGQEHYFVFANALGGIDTLIADGANVLQPELTFNYGRFGNIYTPIDDTENVRLWNQSLVTPWRERNWLWEILSAKGEAAMYDANAEIYDPIIIADADIKMSDKGQLANASFAYLMSESTPMPVILESEEQSRALSQSAADSAEEFNDLSSSLTLAFEVGEKVNVTEVASIAATKLYVTWDESLKDGIEVFVEVDGNSAGSFVTGTDTQPYIVTKTAGQTVQFLTEDDTIESVTVTYYPVTIQAV